MFVLKQFLKPLLLPPTVWLILLLIALVFWPRRWARKLLAVTWLLIFALHSGLLNHALRYPLESSYAPLLDPKAAGSYDAIVVLTSGSVAAEGLIPFPSIDESMFRRLEEAWRLYRIQPKPIVVSGGHVNPFTPAKNETAIAPEYLARHRALGGERGQDVFGEDRSRDTFESAEEVQKILRQRGWKRYLLVTSATHMPRSMLAFASRAPEPVPAPGDFSFGRIDLNPLSFFPSESAARGLFITLHEYLGLANYRWRMTVSE